MCSYHPHFFVGIDYTASNQVQGQRSFEGRCLHAIDPSGQSLNPYQEVNTKYKIASPKLLRKYQMELNNTKYKIESPK